MQQKTKNKHKQITESTWNGDKNKKNLEELLYTAQHVEYEMYFWRISPRVKAIHLIESGLSWRCNITDDFWNLLDLLLSLRAISIHVTAFVMDEVEVMFLIRVGKKTHSFLFLSNSH